MPKKTTARKPVGRPRKVGRPKAKAGKRVKRGAGFLDTLSSIAKVALPIAAQLVQGV